MSERREIVELLRSDLYERVPDEDQESSLWMSPLNWKVRIAGPRCAPLVTVYTPGGEVFNGIEQRPMNADMLHLELP